jgi:MFS family permease
LKSFQTRLYVYCFLRELILIYPFYAIMFVENGLSPVEVSTLFAVWSGIVIALEIPSGALADRYSRKAVLFSGQVLRALGFACWLMFPGFWGYLIGFLLWGTTSALASGAFEALIYDELVACSVESDFVRVLGRARSAGTVGLIATSLSVIWLVDLGYEWLLWASALGALLSGCALLTLPSAARSDHDVQDYRALLREGVQHATTNRSILALIVFSSIAYSLPQSLDEYITILATEVGFRKSMLGPLLAVIYVAQATASAIAHRFEFINGRAYFAVFLSCGLLLILAGQRADMFSIAIVVIFVMMFEIINVLLNGRLQASIPSHIRATISSVKGFGTEMTGIIIFLGMGFAVGDGSYSHGYATLGLIVAIIGLSYLLINPSFDIDDPAPPDEQ